MPILSYKGPKLQNIPIQRPNTPKNEADAIVLISVRSKPIHTITITTTTTTTTFTHTGFSSVSLRPQPLALPLSQITFLSFSYNDSYHQKFCVILCLVLLLCRCKNLFHRSRLEGGGRMIAWCIRLTTYVNIHFV